MDLKPDIDRWQVFRIVLNTFNHMLVGIITYHMLWFTLYTRYHNPFSWHVVLCTIGYVFLMAESILIFSGDNSWTRMLPRHINKTLHWVLQGGGAILSVAGTAVEIDLKARYNKAHFESGHAITGLISMILVILTCLGGIPALYATNLRHRIKPVYLKLFHNLLGTAAFVIGMISFILGYYTSWFQYYTTEALRAFLTVCTVIITILSLISSSRNAFGQIKSLK